MIFFPLYLKKIGKFNITKEIVGQIRGEQFLGDEEIVFFTTLRCPPQGNSETASLAVSLYLFRKVCQNVSSVKLDAHLTTFC